MDRRRPVQRPEGLYREPALMVAVFACVAVMAALLFVNLPILNRIFSPTIPWEQPYTPR